jgi:hypothetical protein
MQLFEFISSIGPTAKIYCAVLIVNIVLAVLSGDWRLRCVAGLFFALWLITNLFPYSEVFASLASFVALSLIQIRRPSEARLSWWIVPVIAFEVGIFLSHAAYPIIGYKPYWALVQIFFAAQLIATIWIGGKLTTLRILSARRQGAKSDIPSSLSPAPFKSQTRASAFF